MLDQWAQYTCDVQLLPSTQVQRKHHQRAGSRSCVGLTAQLLSVTVQPFKKWISDLHSGLRWSGETKQRADADRLTWAVRGPGVTPVNALTPPPLPPPPYSHHDTVHVCKSPSPCPPVEVACARVRARAPGQHYNPERVRRAPLPGFFLWRWGCTGNPARLQPTGSPLTTHRGMAHPSITANKLVAPPPQWWTC